MFFFRKRLKIGTRGSKLALFQAKVISSVLKEYNIDSEIIVIKTKGDLILNKPLFSFGGKNLFIKEIEEKLISGEIDIAVHSLKDLSVFMSDKLRFVCLKRDDCGDCLVSYKGNLNELQHNAKVGTTSLRRRAELFRIRGDLEFVDLRGNLDTRLLKLQRGDIDAIVVSKAGLLRLNLFNALYMYDLDIVPAAGQGVIAIQFLYDFELKDVLQDIESKDTRVCIDCEREYVRRLNASCNYPIGACAVFKNGMICMDVMYGFINDITKSIRFETCDSTPYTVVDKCVGYVKGLL